MREAPSPQKKGIFYHLANNHHGFGWDAEPVYGTWGGEEPAQEIEGPEGVTLDEKDTNINNEVEIADDHSGGVNDLNKCNQPQCVQQ